MSGMGEEVLDIQEPGPGVPVPTSDGCAGEIVREITSRVLTASPVSSTRELPQGDDMSQEAAVDQGVKLGTIPGCFLPCLLNILGAVLFLRIGFSVGNMGVMGTLGILGITAVIAYLTIFSFSAIVTNGRMRGGGAYYMISRNLGPSFGGSSGILFWFTYCVNVTFNAVAFTETIQSSFFGSSGRGIQIVISAVTLSLLFLVGLKGANAFASTNYFIAVCLAVSLVFGIGSLYFATKAFHISTTEYDGNNYDAWFYPAAWDGNISDHRECESDCSYGLKHRLWPDPVKSDQCVGLSGGDQKCTFNLVFAVMFPAMVGTMQGANLSGDLKNPAKSIPNGTIGAVSTAFILYILLVFGTALTMDKNALHYDMNCIQHACLEGLFVIMGVTAACLSTALGSMFGAARVLQAIAKDGVFPILNVFAKGSGPNDEPRLALLVTYLVAVAGVLVGGLDAVAPILTNCFLVTYALVNLACFLLTIAGVPNWRPTFKLYTWYTALFGCLANVAAMFYLNPPYAAATLVILAGLFAYVSFTCEAKDWGDISQALIFHQTRKMLLSLQQKGATVTKFWRPSIMLLCGPDARGIPTGLLEFLDDLKKGGLFIIGCPIVSHSMFKGGKNRAEAIRTSLIRKTEHLKAFCRVAVAPTMRLAVQNLLLSGGIGPMLADTVIVPLPRGYYTRDKKDRPQQVVPDWLGEALSQEREDGPGTEDTVSAATDTGVEVKGLTEIVGDALTMNKNVGIACNFEKAAAAADMMRFGRQAGTPDRGTRAGSDRASSPAGSQGSGSARPGSARSGASDGAPSMNWLHSYSSGEDMRVDVWRLNDRLRPGAPVWEADKDKDFLVCVQMGYVMQQQLRRKSSRFCRSSPVVRLRVFQYGGVQEHSDVESLQEELASLLHDIRVEAELEVVPCPEQLSEKDGFRKHSQQAGSVIAQRCGESGGLTRAVFITLPSESGAEKTVEWAAGLNALTDPLPPCVLLRGGEVQGVTTTAI